MFFCIKNKDSTGHSLPFQMTLELQMKKEIFYLLCHTSNCCLLLPLGMWRSAVKGE